MVTLLLGEALEYAGVTTLHPGGVGALAVACMALLIVPSRFVPLILLALAVYLPSVQRIVIMGADFPLLRFAITIGLARLLAGGALSRMSIIWIDIFVIIGALTKIVCVPVTQGNPNLVFQQIGSAIDAVGAYFVMRASIRSLADLRAFSTGALWICAPVTVIFLIEQSTGRNMLSIFGAPAFSQIRMGKIRCQGAFSHSILAGCFFVALLPVWIGRLGEGVKGVMIAASGLLIALTIVICCASSTPVVAMVFVGCGFAGYLFWRQLRLVWIAGIIVGIALHFVMAKGVWHLIARIDLVGGSTGYHRYHLIDKAITYFGEWWLMGTAGTRHWGYGLQDVTNQYVLEGVRGGFLATLALFASMVFAFRDVGYWLHRLPPRTADHFLVYSIGACIFGQMAIFLAVSYFGQTTMIWWFSIGMAGFLAEKRMDDRVIKAVRPSSIRRGRGVRDAPLVTASGAGAIG